MKHEANTNPLVTVVIPTFRRPELLPRAVKSALDGLQQDMAEVVVVPNGNDDTWISSLAAWKRDSRIRIFPLPEADQNAARNRGLDMARGELVRFLDDDDYLFPEIAMKQYKLMQEEALDFSSAGATMLDEEGRWLGDLAQPITANGLVSAISHQRLQLPFTHVYRRSTIGEARWPVGLRQSEDIVWLVRYASAEERSWRRLDEPVGVWFQHGSSRQSLDRASGVVHEPTAQALIEARDRLADQGRLDSGASAALSSALWQLVHRAFPFSPLYWSGVARQADTLSPGSRPSERVYHFPVLRHLDPLLVMSALLPKRWASLGYDAIKGALFGRDYRRTL